MKAGERLKLLSRRGEWNPYRHRGVDFTQDGGILDRVKATVLIIIGGKPDEYWCKPTNDLVGEDRLLLSDCIYLVSLKNEKFIAEERRSCTMINSDSRKADLLGKCDRIAG